MAYGGGGGRRGAGGGGGGGRPSIWPPPPSTPCRVPMDGYRRPWPAAPSSTPAPEPAAGAIPPPSPAVLAKEVEKKLFVSETALAPRGIAHPARPGLAMLGNVADNKFHYYDAATKTLRTRMRMALETAEAHLQTSPVSDNARFSAPVLRQVLQEEAHNHIGDTGHWLEPAEHAEVWQQAVVSDPYWVPPAGWKPGDDASLVTGDLLVKSQVEEHKEKVKSQMEQLMCKEDGDFDAERAYNSLKDQLVLPLKMNAEPKEELTRSEAVPATVHRVGSGQRIIPRTVGRVNQGGQCPARKSSFRVYKPAAFLRGFSTPRPDTSDLNPLFEAIGPVKNTVHWPLNGTDTNLQESYDKCIGHQRLYHAVHGKALDVSSLLGPNKKLFTTAMSGTQYVDVSYNENGRLYQFTLPVDARLGWNYNWHNEHGIFEYTDSSENPYAVEGHRMHVDFKSDYKGLCPSGHGFILLGPEPVRIACKLMSGYQGELPAPPQVRMACAMFINYLIEAVKFNDVHHFNSESLVRGSVCMLGEVEPSLSDLMTNWSNLSKSQMHFLIRRLHTPTAIPLSRVDGIQNLYPMVNAVAIRPFNTLTKEGTNARTWTCYPKDENADGSPHPLSLEYLKKWPHHPEVVLPEKRVCNVAAVVQNTKSVDLTLPKYAKLMDILEPAAKHHSRLCMLTRSGDALKMLNWLKKACI